MRKVLLGLTALSLAAAPIAAQAQNRMSQGESQGVKTGTLQCDVSGSVGFIVGSKRDVACTFKMQGGKAQRYVGSIDKFGLDVGVSGKSVMVWQVVAPSGDMRRMSLAGRYSGVSAGAAVGVGASADVLVNNASGFNLQPVSLRGQNGVNLAAGVGSLTLKEGSARG